MNRPIKNTPIDTAKLMASIASTSTPGSGMTIISTMPTMASAIASSAVLLFAPVGGGVGAWLTRHRIARSVPACSVVAPARRSANTGLFRALANPYPAAYLPTAKRLALLAALRMTPRQCPDTSLRSFCSRPWPHG